MSFQTLTESGQRLGRCHIVWLVVPSSWTDNRKSPVGDCSQLDRGHFSSD